MINQSNTSPTPGTTKYSHKYAIPTNIPPTTPNDPYSYQYYPQQAQAESKFPSLKPLSPHQIKIQDESQQNWKKKQNQLQIQQLQNQNTLAKLLMFDSSDLASRENNNGGKIASSQYYSLNEGNSSNGQKSLNISNAVKYVNSRYQAYPTQADSPTIPPTQPHKQYPQQTTSNPANTANPTNPTNTNVIRQSSVYPNISNLPLFQSEYQYNYGYTSNTNQLPLYRNPSTNIQHNLYEYSKQNKQTTYSNTNTNSNKYPNQYKNNPHPQQQHQLDLSQSSHNNPSQQSDQSQDVLYTFLIKLINILNNKLRTQYRYTFQALYLNSKFKPFIPNPPNTANTGHSTGYQQWNNYSINKNNNNSWNQNKSWNKNNNNIIMEPNQMQYTYALPTDMPKNNKNNYYANNRQSNSINTYTYSHTSGDKSVSLSNDPDKGKEQDKEREKLRVSDQQDMKGRDKQLQSIPSHALSSISSIDQQGNIHNISYPYNVSTSMNDNNMYQFTQRKHIFAIQDNNPNNYGNQTYPYPTPTATNNNNHNNKPNIHTHTNTNKISNTKSLNLQKSPYTQTHPSPHHHSPNHNHQAQHNWQYNNNSPTFHKIIQEQQQQSNTNTNSNIGSSIHAGVVSQFQFNSNLKVKAKGKNANIRKKTQEPAYPYPHYVQSTEPTPKVNKQNDYNNNNSSQQVSPTKPLSIQLAPLTPSQYAFPKADKSIELTLAAKEVSSNNYTSTNKKQSPTKNPTPAKLEPLSTDSLIDTILQTSNQPIYLQTSQQTPQADSNNPHNRYYNNQQEQQEQQEEEQQHQQQQQQQDEQNINQQDNNRQYNLQYNSRNNTNNHNSNSQSNSNNSSNKKNINNNYNIMNTNTNMSSNTNNLFNTNTNTNINMNNNVKSDSNLMGSNKVGNNNPQSNINHIQNNINQIPTMDHTTINNTTNPSNNITANINNNISNSDKVIQQQPIYIDVGQPLTYQKILLNNQNIGRSISSYVENNIFENAGNRQYVPPAAEYRSESRERPATYNPAPMHFQNLPVPVRPNSNIQNNFSINTGRSSPQILLKYPHIVVSSPRQTQNPQRELIPIRFNSVSPPAKNQRIFSQNKYPHIKILQQKPVQPQPQPKQIFVTFNQDNSTRRPVSQPSRPISTLTNVKPIVMPFQIKANIDHKKLVQVRADYFGHDARVPAGNVIINNKVVRQASPVLKEVRSTPQLPRINVIPEQNNILNSGRIRNANPPPPYNIFPVPNKTQPPFTSIPIPQQSPKKSQPNQSSVRSSLQSNKLSNHQARPQSALMATTPINTLKQVPFVKVQDVLPKSKIINTGDNISSQRQVRMDQTIINKLDGQIQQKPTSKTNIGNGTNAYFDDYQAPKKLRPSIQQPQQLHNNQYLINVEPSPFIKGKQAFNFQTSPSTSPKHVLHTSPPPQIRHPHHIFPTKQQKIPEQLPLHPIYREYHDASSRPGSNRKKLNLVSKQQAYDSKYSNSRQEISDY